jgi:hypothetical protein
MKTSINWALIAELQPKGYCEIQDDKGKRVVHGPIETFTVKGNEVHITLKWVAEMPLPGEEGFGTWVKGKEEDRVVLFPANFVPYLMESTPEKGDRVRTPDGNFLMYIGSQEESDARILMQIS